MMIWLIAAFALIPEDHVLAAPFRSVAYHPLT